MHENIARVNEALPALTNSQLEHKLRQEERIETRHQKRLAKHVNEMNVYAQSTLQSNFLYSLPLELEGVEPEFVKGLNKENEYSQSKKLLLVR